MCQKPKSNRELVLSREEVRQCDQIAVTRYALPSLVLMENAGAAAARQILSELGDPSGSAVCIIAGPGNNGGDGFVVARHLRDSQVGVEVLICGPRENFKGDLENEEQLNDAIYNDFGKSSFETYATELALIYHEIKLALGKLKRWSKPKRVRTNLANFPAKSYIIPEPYGNALIIGAWNYPYQLSLLPAVPAIAAGSCLQIRQERLPR